MRCYFCMRIACLLAPSPLSDHDTNLLTQVLGPIAAYRGRLATGRAVHDQFRTDADTDRRSREGYEHALTLRESGSRTRVDEETAV